MLGLIRVGLSVVPFDDQDTSVYAHRDGSGEHQDQQRGSILAVPRLLHLVVRQPFPTAATVLLALPCHAAPNHVQPTTLHCEQTNQNSDHE